MSHDDQRPIAIAAPEITTAEEEAVLRVLRSGRLAQGPEVAAFEQSFGELQHADHVIATSNGTTALHAALHVAGVRPGDEVLVPAFTFAASANAVIAAGARPVFVDISDHWHIDLAAAGERVTQAHTSQAVRACQCGPSPLPRSSATSAWSGRSRLLPTGRC